MNSQSLFTLVSAVVVGCVCAFHASAASTEDMNAIRTSQHVAVRDGTRLAIDIYRPSLDDKVIDKPLPVILVASLTTVRKANVGLSSVSRFYMDLLKQGYVIASLETRGHGASFGKASPTRIEAAEDYWDLYDVVEWLAAQPWSDGKIGMVGCSNQGMTQLRTAAVMPPHLAAIAPTSAPADWATIWSINGVTRNVSRGNAFSVEAAAVDADHDGSLLQAALMEQGIRGVAHLTRPFRDASVTVSGVHALPTYWWNWLPNYTTSKTPVFQYAGWRDFFPEQSFALYRSLARQGVPQKLVIGPWYHCEWYGSDLTNAAAETGRWYDHWLKGIDSGLMDEPPIRYYVLGAPAGQEWKTADRWPLPNEKRQTYFLGDQGSLQSRQPTTASRKDDYVVNYGVTTEKLATRWSMETLLKIYDPQNANKNLGLLPIPTAELDTASLTYTSAPLQRDSELTGFPVVTLWISSTAKDQDFFVYLEEVDTNGKSTLLTEGAMRASNRAMREPPFDNEGMPWHPSYKADQQSLQPGVPTKLEWSLFPFSNYIRKGHRLRVTINSFDKDAWDTPQVSPAPTVSIYRDVQRPSSITFPFVSK